MRLFIVRHAQTSWNAEGRAQGSTDIPLDPIGEEQAECLAFGLPKLESPLILSSDLMRCRQTASAISLVNGGSIEYDQNLRERAMAEWEGLPFPELRARLLAAQGPEDLNGLESRSPSGESVMDVWRRLDPICERLRQLTSDCVVVSHGGTSALLLSKLIHGVPMTARAFRFGNATITELSRTHSGMFAIERLNDGSHFAAYRIKAEKLDGTVY